MVGRIIVIDAYDPSKYRLHVYGCRVGELDDEDFQNFRIRDKTVGILVETTNDFACEHQLTCDEHDSYQIRPKAIFKNRYGLFYKLGGEQVYLTKEQEQEIYEHVEHWKTIDWENYRG